MGCLRERPAGSFNRAGPAGLPACLPREAARPGPVRGAGPWAVPGRAHAVFLRAGYPPPRHREAPHGQAVGEGLALGVRSSSYPVPGA